MKQVLFINRGDSDNLGDQAIKVSLENLLKKMYCEVDFYDFTNVYNESHYVSKKSKITTRKKQ